MHLGNRTLADKLVLFVAEGFGSGRLPVAPGTFGTVVGFAWIYLILLPECLWLYLAGIVIGFFASVWIGGRAETLLGKSDPGSIVIDEITALPLVFLPAVIWTAQEGAPHSFSHYITRTNILIPVIAFLAFRLFDVAKPFGIRKVQSVHGGWGLTLDDFLAAVPAAMVLLIYLALVK